MHILTYSCDLNRKKENPTERERENGQNWPSKQVNNNVIAVCGAKVANGQSKTGANDMQCVCVVHLFSGFSIADASLLLLLLLR